MSRSSKTTSKLIVRASFADATTTSRWIRLLFEREFPFDDLLSLWDALFVIDPALSLVDYICVAMILRIRDQRTLTLFRPLVHTPL